MFNSRAEPVRMAGACIFRVLKEYTICNMSRMAQIKKYIECIAFLALEVSVDYHHFMVDGEIVR